MQFISEIQDEKDLPHDEEEKGFTEDTSKTMGSCKHLLWQGVRASSAAPYYLADYGIGDERWQDGAVTCNNPSMPAMPTTGCFRSWARIE